ncbi:hypothetical protein BDM02DRAFT_3189012 [Thelephora ganbajun]|uniref:Uncharacterized protein n=1 Tax=Thelephora ganbajun TaxID=370292 RepID=A0ACB6Z9D3_THEGA|nr:hypothetical protein BDM02DRAFT_3189012 [Thelephora ganbajun]
MSAPGAIDPSEVSELSGNSANAEVAARDQVKAALELRCKFFTPQVNYARYLADGLVGSTALGTDRSPLKSGSWAFVFSDSNVYVGEVLALYSKEAGAGINHAWQQSTNSIGAISYLIVQAYEAPTSGRTNSFRSVLNSQVAMWADRAFLHVPVTQFLCKLQDPPTSTMPGKLTLSGKDWLVFQKMAGSSSLRENLAKAIKELNAATRGKKVIAE